MSDNKTSLPNFQMQQKPNKKVKIVTPRDRSQGSESNLVLEEEHVSQHGNNDNKNEDISISACKSDFISIFGCSLPKKTLWLIIILIIVAIIIWYLSSPSKKKTLKNSKKNNDDGNDDSNDDKNKNDN